MLMKGNEALAEAAVHAGCRFFFGYPITPQNELPEYLSRRLPEVGGVFLQAESEVAAINMVYGAAGAGARVMTSSSSPGISLKMEGISYLAGAELPCVIVNMMRGGPGLGSIQPAQSDYFQATRGGGHGDYRVIVLAPASVPEIVQLAFMAFDLADRYRNPVMILADGLMGQMMEPVDFGEIKQTDLPLRPWATTGCLGRPCNVINSLYLDPYRLEEHNRKLQKKYEEISKCEQRAEEFMTAGARFLVIAFGTAARVAMEAVEEARRKGLPVGLIRPVTLWPFPVRLLRQAAENVQGMLVVEMNAGQMVDDVRLATEGRVPVRFFGRMGGVIPTVKEVLAQIEQWGDQLCP
ncbi:MAG: 3-methyl-2-oxobutanoate dehydrogenase subunit VorB [Bacillota bacterium]